MISCPPATLMLNSASGRPGRSAPETGSLSSPQGVPSCDLGAPQHHLLRPGGQGEAAAVLAGAGSEPGELEPALDDPAMQLQPFGLDAGDPPAHQIAAAGNGFASLRADHRAPGRSAGR